MAGHKPTNYSTVSGHMQDPRVLFISYSSDEVQGFEVQWKDKQGATIDFTAADNATRL